MIRRCDNPYDDSYKNYGARGVMVCPKWYNYEIFLLDVGRRPSPQHSIDRIDNNKGYYPENVKWSTRKEQQRNKRDNIIYTFMKETKTLADWADIVRMPYHVLFNRIKVLKWDVERAFTEPKHNAGTSKRL